MWKIKGVRGRRRRKEEEEEGRRKRRRRKSHLKVPQEIVGDFEVGSDGEDFVDQVFDADDAELAQPLLDDVVVEGASSALQLSVSALVDEFLDRLEVGITPGDVRVGDTQHAQRRLVQLDESGVVNLAQAEELKNLRREKGEIWGKRMT